MNIIVVNERYNFQINDILFRIYNHFDKNISNMDIYDLDVECLRIMYVTDTSPLTCKCYEHGGMVFPKFENYHYYKLELTEEEKTILILNNNFLTKLIT